MPQYGRWACAGAAVRAGTRATQHGHEQGEQDGRRPLHRGLLGDEVTQADQGARPGPRRRGLSTVRRPGESCLGLSTAPARPGAKMRRRVAAAAPGTGAPVARTVFETHAPDPRLVDRALEGSRPGSAWLADVATEAAADARPPLTGPQTADLVVVGGGYAGLWTALRAVQREPGRRVVLLEAATVGWAASGRNGGFVEASLTHGRENGLARWPEETDLLDRLGAREPRRDGGHARRARRGRAVGAQRLARRGHRAAPGAVAAGGGRGRARRDVPRRGRRARRGRLAHVPGRAAPRRHRPGPPGPARGRPGPGGRAAGRRRARALPRRRAGDPRAARPRAAPWCGRPRAACARGRSSWPRTCSPRCCGATGS